MKKGAVLIIGVLSFAFNVKEFVVCKKLNRLTPDEITTNFSVKDNKIYAFAYLKDIKQDRDIDVVWEKKVKDKWKIYSDVKLQIKKGPRWRTYSSMRIKGDYFAGEWRVSLMDKNSTLKSVEFNITK